MDCRICQQLREEEAAAAVDNQRAQELLSRATNANARGKALRAVAAARLRRLEYLRRYEDHRGSCTAD